MSTTTTFPSTTAACRFVFYYFKDHSTPTYNRDPFAKAIGRRQPSPLSPLSIITPPPGAPIRKRARLDHPPVQISIGIWNDTKTKQLFAEHDIDVRAALQSIIVTFDTVNASKDLSPFLLDLGANFMNERLREKMSFIWGRVKYFSLAYSMKS